MRQHRPLAAEFLRCDDGALAPILTMLLAVLVAITGMTIDIGRVMWVQRQLQASSDAAALAGALSVADNVTSATNAAKAYSGTAGNFNAVRGATSVSIVDNPDGTPKIWCSTKVAPACAGTLSGKNVIKVTQQAVVPMYFLRLVGTPTMTPRAVSTASARGGSGRSLDVVVVLDATGSMNDPGGCSITGASKLTCAKAGANALLQGLNPALDRVAFMVFPGLSQTGVTANTTCGKTLDVGTGTKTYKQVAAATGTPPNATYTVSGLSSDFASNGAINAKSVSAIVVGVGKSDIIGQTCKGLQSTSGNGTYFADAIAAAQNELTVNGRTKSQKVIVILSDGDASTSADKLPDNATKCDKNGKNCVPLNLCQRAIANAKAAAAAGTWVYSVAYRAPKSGGCAYDTENLSGVSQKGLSGCDTMRAIASEASKFYSDGTKATECVATGGSNTDLITLFKNISSDLTMPRLWPEAAV